MCCIYSTLYHSHCCGQSSEIQNLLREPSSNKTANKAKASRTFMTHADSFAQNKEKDEVSRFLSFSLQHFYLHDDFSLGAIVQLIVTS